MPVFFFSDIEGSTKLWETYPDSMGAVLTRHDTILKTRIEEFGGFVVKHTGDGMFAIFEDGEPLRGAIEIQRSINDEDWKDLKQDIRIRISLHSGTAEKRGDDYFGADVNKAARLLTVGWGGQILLTDEVVSACDIPDGAEITDHYVHILKDLSEPIRVYGLTHPDVQLTKFPSLRSLSAHPNNLPLQPTQFIGRKAEIEAILLLLDKPACRILTLIGPGGIGKTRLALQVAAERAHEYGDGVFFVPLESLESFEYVVQSIADSLSLNFHNKLGQKEQLLEFLREKEVLLVIDNFEHVIDAATLIVEISKAALGVTIMLTSREVLNLHGEWLFEVQGLPIDIGIQDEIIEPGEDAATLFIESARRMKSNFKLDGEGLNNVIDICRSVDGMPLGIELAASWVRFRSLYEIAEEMKNSLNFLHTRSRDVPERHRSIEAVFDYSWNLLSNREKGILLGLTVFRGGFSFESAREVVGASIHDISVLAEKSIIRKTPQGRFGFHPVLKEFVVQKYEQPDAEKEEVQNLHSGYFADFMLELEEELNGENQVQSIEMIDTEIENVRVGWERAVWNADSKLLGKYLHTLFTYFDIKGLYLEGKNTFQRASDNLSSVANIVYASSQSRQGMFEFRLGNPGEARKLCLNSIFISQEMKNGKERAFSLSLLGYIYFSNGRYPEAKQYSREALEIYSEMEYEWGIAYCLNNMGRVARAEGETEKAREYFLESLAIWDRIGDKRSSIVSLNNLGATSHFLGEINKANDYHKRCLSIARDIGNPRLIAVSLLNTGNIIKMKSDYIEADLLYRESLEYINNIGDKQLKALCLNNMGSVACDLGSFREAEALCIESLDIKRKLANSAGVAASLNILGGVYIGLYEYQKAREHLFEALQVAFDINQISLCLEILKNVSRLFDTAGKPELSLQILVFIIDSPDSSLFINDKAIEMVQTIRSNLLNEISKKEIEELEEQGRDMEIDMIYEMVKKELE